MAAIDRLTFIQDLQAQLAEALTIKDTRIVINAVNRALSDYDITRSDQRPEISGESEDLLTYFLDAKRIEGKSDGTIHRYDYILRRLLKDVGVPYSRMTVYHIRNYYSAEKACGVASSTLEGNRYIYRSFFGWLRREGLIEKDPMDNMAAIKQPKVIRKPLSPLELAKIERVAIKEGRARNVAILLFLESTGCRVSEMCALNRDDIDLKTQCITVFGKGAKERKVWFDDETAWWLEQYMMNRKDDSPALFAGKRSCDPRISPDGVRSMLHRLGKRAGVENVHPHRFRRTRATSLIDRGMPIQEVSTILGHERIDTTMRYVFIDERNVANDFKKYA